MYYRIHLTELKTMDQLRQETVDLSMDNYSAGIYLEDELDAQERAYWDAEMEDLSNE